MNKRNSSAPSSQFPAEQSERETTRLQQQVEELTAALQRERADATNQRRHFDEQLAGVRTSVKANVVAELLPVIDNFERALKHVPGDQSQESRVESQEEQRLLDWISGVQKILAQFEKTLQGMGVERIQTVGAEFDPRYHEAVSMEEGDGTKEVVCEELQPGYKIGSDVIRHAMVRVKST